ncbi:MAG: type I-C CRISPR-associated protein Cas8c/Csd1 [Bacteroides sp.]|nr:type I-C CRISPR-associated protein Cas8c/Csd1 [Eubacterium sp.]MCM1418933.1 type I-C CRISPR-associated protein Cas8c/Csd1 [Roseburia sp.]MCM1462123.1 type I-C CRISPR-associated protein Cas8c/Csd1 [Bacteroides sp.]
MSWASELYAVYDKATELKDDCTPLLPLSHSTAKAQLEVMISKNGKFLGAHIIEDEKDAVTIIPVTEDSGARSRGICPHPFVDKLIYIAGDYCDYCSAKKGDHDKFKAYIEQLARWKNSEYSHPSVSAVYDYLSKGVLIGDLVAARIFTIDDSGRLTNDKIQKIGQSECFIRFKVIGVSSEERTWRDKTLYDSFIEFNSSEQNDEALCYATGKKTFCTYKHPSKVLNAGDKGKLFSANDESGFTYRGRFSDKEQTVAIGYEFSQKMHNALKWLISRQGMTFGTFTLVLWNSVLSELPDIRKDSRELIDDLDDDTDGAASAPLPSNFTSYKSAVKKAVFGNNPKLEFGRKVMILALDEATTGRISVNTYTELYGAEFYENVVRWHSDTAWNRYDTNSKQSFVGSFSLNRISDCLCGIESNGRLVCNGEGSKKYKYDTVARLIPCVTEGRRIPSDIVRQLTYRTAKRSACGKSWLYLLETACGIIRKSEIEKGDDHGMALDKDCTSRDYLFGRLIAIAEVAENSTYGVGEEGRTTNAERYFEKFSNAPSTTWKTVMQRLKPYFNRMGKGKRIFYQNLIDEVTNKFERDDFIDNSKLAPEFLLAYSCQRKELYTGKNNDKSNGDNKED